MSYNTLKENLPSFHKALHKKFDGDDPIFKGLAFHGLPRNGGPRGGRKTPIWALNWKDFQKILLHSFPRLNEPSAACPHNSQHLSCRCPFHQRLDAGRWARIAYAYWRQGNSASAIAQSWNEAPWGEETSPEKWTEGVIKNILHHMRRAAAGLRANGSGKITGKPSGRPKKIRESSAAPYR